MPRWSSISSRSQSSYDWTVTAPQKRLSRGVNEADHWVAIIILLRKIKQFEVSIVGERIANSILNDNDHSFWSEIKCLRSNKTGLSTLVDGHTDANNISHKGSL
jgi:hypothetical protein